MPNARTLLENLLAQGELEAAIRGYRLLCQQHADSAGSSAVAQLSARYHTLMAQQRDGTVSQENYLLERARINRAMLDAVGGLPAEWDDQPLHTAGFSVQPPATAHTAAPRKGFLERWGLILGIVASLTTIAGITLRDVLFPKPPEPKVQAPTTQPQQQSALNTEKPAEKTLEKSPLAQPQERETTSPKFFNPPATLPSSATSDSDTRFRSFAKTMFADGMERGKVGKKLAFRNLQTNEILCCYADAEDFNGGRAYVSQDGVNYFYINKKGERVADK